MLSESFRAVACAPHRLVCEAMTRLIADKFPEASTVACPDITDLVSVIASSRAELLLLQMPDCEVRLVERMVSIIKRECPGIAVLCIANSAHADVLPALMTGGIDAWLPCSERATVLFAAIRSVRRKLCLERMHPDAHFKGAGVIPEFRRLGS